MSAFSKKHNAEEKPDPKVKNSIVKHARGNELPCAVAFLIAKELSVSAETIGKNVDLVNYRLTKCQLGLFGYTPEKKKIAPQDNVDPKIKTAIETALIDQRLPCKNAWDIAVSLGVHKIKISTACETLGIKINKCQLGAF